MTQPNRPLSPHLQIYRLPLLGILSITHRLAGIALSAGAVLLAYWLGSAAYGPAADSGSSTTIPGSEAGAVMPRSRRARASGRSAHVQSAIQSCSTFELKGGTNG